MCMCKYCTTTFQQSSVRRTVAQAVAAKRAPKCRAFQKMTMKKIYIISMEAKDTATTATIDTMLDMAELSKQLSVSPSAAITMVWSSK